MSGRILRKAIIFAPALVATLFATSALAGHTGAAARTRRVSGHAEFQLALGPNCASPIGLCTAGVIAGDLQGTIAGAAIAFNVPADASVPTVGAYVNHIVISTAEGELRCTEVGGANTAGDGDFAGLCTVTGGSGRFAGAGGSFAFRGTFTPTTGGSYAYDGKLTLP